MTDTLTKQTRLSSDLSMCDPGVLALFAEISYARDKQENKITVKTTKDIETEIFKIWIPENNTIANPWKAIGFDGGLDGFQGIAVGRDLNGDNIYDEVCRSALQVDSKGFANLTTRITA